MSEETAIPLDLSALAEICGESEDLMKRVLEEFVKTTPALVERIRTAVQVLDLVEAKNTIHTLKGSSRTIGADALASACQAAENSLVGTSVAKELPERFVALEAALDDVYTYVKGYLGTGT